MRLALTARGPLVGLLVVVFGLLSCADAPTAPRTGTALVADASASSHSAPAVVISQIYGGGGNTGATLRNDFVELFNRSASAVSLTGWSVQYASSAGSTWQVTALSGVIPAGGYYLVQQGAGAGGTTSLPTPDATGSIAMSATAGKVILSSALAALSGTCPTTTPAVDHVGYGTAATDCGSGTTATLSNTLAAIRGDNGCAFSAALSADFSTGAPSPRNSASPTHPCAATAIPVSASIAPATATITVGSSVTLTASAFAAASQPIPGVAFAWSSSPTGIVTVSAAGLVTGVGIGTATVTAVTINGVTGQATVEVNAAPPPPLPPVRFSEIHYDNTGTDVNEAIEVEGPAGTDLTGWSIVLYNGNGGVAYGTTVLSGVLADQCSGRGTLFVAYPTNGIQNGGTPPEPDGMALVDASGGVVEFLSYEGVMTATDGPANGRTSIDIGVMQPSTTPLGQSLQRDAAGVWSGPITATFGFCTGYVAPPPPNSISFSGRLSSEPPLPVGFEDQLFATLRSGTGVVLTSTFTWSSVTPLIASIDANGVMRSLAAGTAVIRATAEDGTTATYALPTQVGVSSTTAEYAGNTEFGEPTDGDPSDDFIVRRAQFTSSYNATKGTPNWVSYNLDASHFGAEDRCDCFTFDPELPATFTRYTTADYTGAGAFAGYGIDRGHLARSFDRTTGSYDNATTYYFTNIIPQAADNNQGPWAAMENYLGDLARFSNREVYIITGPAGNRGTVKGEGKITIPTAVWKVAVSLPRNAGLTSINSWQDLTVIAVIMPNDAGIRNVNWQTYRTTVDAVEALSGYDLLALLRDDIEIAVESGTVPPDAMLDGPWSAFAGDPLALSGAGSTDGDGDALTYAWDFGDGASGSGVAVSHSYADSGMYTVRLIVTDTRGLADTATSTASIAMLPHATGIGRARTGVLRLVGDGVLSAGQGNSLTVKLDAALRSLERGSTSAAIGQLGAFLNELKALVQSGRLTEAQAAPIREVIARVLRNLSG